MRRGLRGAGAARGGSEGHRDLRFLYQRKLLS
ncbi:protein of unknown function [Methylacidimicrobium sp. AP8]|nr:protein of unknown function [Methylacidimicrobium sp. AP8]